MNAEGPQLKKQARAKHLNPEQEVKDEPLRQSWIHDSNDGATGKLSVVVAPVLPQSRRSSLKEGQGAPNMDQAPMIGSDLVTPLQLDGLKE